MSVGMLSSTVAVAVSSAENFLAKFPYVNLVPVFLFTQRSTTTMMRSRESSLLLCVLVGAVIVAVCDARSHYIKNVPYHRQVTDYACGDGT